MDEGGNNLMECIMFVVFVVFVIEILDFCVPYVVCGGLGSGVWMWDVAADADGRTTFNVGLFELGRRIELTEKQHPFIFLIFFGKFKEK